MPRPKRSRVAPSRPVAAEHRQSSATPPPATRPTAVSLPSVPSSDIYDVSDQEKERRAARLSARTRRTAEPNPEQAKAFENAKQRQDKAMKPLDNIMSNSKQASGSSADDSTESPNIEYSRRDSMTMTATRQPRLTDASGLDLDDDVFGNLDDSLDDSHDIGDDMQSAHHSRSTDTSSFNIAMFRRKPRQSSIVGRDDAPIRPSSRGATTPSFSSYLNLGCFKRRQREPSILGTARKDSAQRPQSRGSNFGSVIGDDDYGPNDGPTPLNKTTRHSGQYRQPESDPEDSPTLPSRKRKSLADQDGREKRLAVESHEEVIHQSIEVNSTPPLSSSPRRVTRRSTQEQPSTPDRCDPEMAPPASSGSSIDGQPISWPSLDILTHRVYRKHVPARVAKTPEFEDDDSELPSPPSLTHSPNYGTARTRAIRRPAVPAPPQKVTTAALTSLMPQRRPKSSGGREDSSDSIDMESEDEIEVHGEDELSYVNSRAASRRGARMKTRKGKRTNANGSAQQGKGRKSVRTYGGPSSDKENDDGEESDEAEVELGSVAGDDTPRRWRNDENSQELEERLGEEHKNAIKKFKEVDNWEMSFEEVTGSSSPMRDAR